MVQAHERVEVLRGNIRRCLVSDVRIRIRRVTHHEDTHVIRCMVIDRTTLADEDLAVSLQHVRTRLALTARLRADKERRIRTIKGLRRIICHGDVAHALQRGIGQLHGNTFSVTHVARHLQQRQVHDRVGAEDLACSDSPQQRVRNVAGSAGDGDFDLLRCGGHISS